MMRRPPENLSSLTLPSTTSTTSSFSRVRLASTASANRLTSILAVPSSSCTKAILPRLPTLVRMPVTKPAKSCGSRLGLRRFSGVLMKPRTSFS
ncbi:hypothetical protein D3C85_1427370 [compost metagenome]